MSSEGIALRGNWIRFKGKAAGHVRSNRSYANYPSYAALLAIAVWLFGHYPAFSTIGFQFARPGLLLVGLHDGGLRVRPCVQPGARGRVAVAPRRRRALDLCNGPRVLGVDPVGFDAWCQ